MVCLRDRACGARITVAFVTNHAGYSSQAHTACRRASLSCLTWAHPGRRTRHMQEGRLVSHGRARALQPGPVQARLAACRAAEGLPAPAADLAADLAAQLLT
eukprot:scaffold82702_cov59-Phaeocystis_antarctica.AAC.3